MAPRKPDNSERINVFFSPSVVDDLREEADMRGTTVSGLVRMIVLEWLRKEEKGEHRDH